jgi:hypothetical protein
VRGMPNLNKFGTHCPIISKDAKSHHGFRVACPDVCLVLLASMVYGGISRQVFN